MTQTKLLLFSLFFAGLFMACDSVNNVENDSLPNIVYINVDDLGWADLAFMGSKFYETPNLDRLASRSMLFTQAYAGAANCAPSRACLLSGMNTPRHRIYTVANSNRGDKRTRKIIPTSNTETLADSVYTLAEMLRDQGYVTGTFGKWHLGEDPRTQGFDINVGGSHNGNPGRNGYFSPYNVKYLSDGPEGEYLTDRLAGEAMDFVAQYQDSTFFLYLPFYTVHTPIMGKEALVEKFEGKKGSEGQDRADYAAMVASMDENVGRLLDQLDSLGLTENTLILFTSDNGGIRSISSQQPLRAGKGSYYEGGIRVPMLVSWPGKVEAGSQCDVPVTNLDIYPTIQNIVGTEQRNKLLDGNDISPLFYGDSIAERPLYWHFPIYLQAYNMQDDDGRDPLFRTRPGSVVRLGDWKLHEYFEEGGLELYNLTEDIGERQNLIKEYPEKAEELYQLLQDWRQQTHAPVPTEKNPAYDAAYEQQIISEVGK
ncbi:arylsulfatase A-like enzyme [Catalinimonas alkaloidigena]|uniref:sulfatase n=1 Tax=Catalinimonas alkaloidigena TaxID=1075417 RepID=UPI00240515AE|nr:sulfatase [Catalinimonas alkaloidigena]MDF9794904.1 arylsulfatase A-like enzyme [Catalinimonas alkaloidigena]